LEAGDKKRTKWVTSGNNIFMILFSILDILVKKISVITRQERRRLVLELCNEGKTKHEIAKDARISFGDIGVILNNAVGGEENRRIQRRTR
jgi:hypothetical protein